MGMSIVGTVLTLWVTGAKEIGVFTGPWAGDLGLGRHLSM